jgi:hypothetical protein
MREEQRLIPLTLIEADEFKDELEGNFENS